jgi:hypothetical protein
MAKGDVETVFRDGRWINVGGGLMLSTHPDKESAIRHGRLLARRRSVAHRVRDAGEREQ